MNRKELKLAVFYKPGILRSDRPLGTASIKLAALEQTCTIHESVDLFESEHKKKIEGKLEVKLRIKEALGQTKASDILPQRWLVIDRFEEPVNFQIFIIRIFTPYFFCSLKLRNHHRHQGTSTIKKFFVFFSIIMKLLFMKI
jgi:hypothetical protein